VYLSVTFTEILLVALSFFRRIYGQ